MSHNLPDVTSICLKLRSSIININIDGNSCTLHSIHPITYRLIHISNMQYSDTIFRRISYIIYAIFIVVLIILNVFLTRRILFLNYESSRYSYYMCTQILNESEHYLVDWLDHQFNVLGFKNVCLINVGHPLSMSLRNRFRIAYVEKKNRIQEFHYCLSSCFIDEPMSGKDLLMIQDIDEYLNVRKADVIFDNYHNYEQFHFKEIRYGYVLETDNEIMNHSLRKTNLWRKPHHLLGEYEENDIKDLFKCQVYDKWPSCSEGNGKEMIRVDAIKSLGVHFHESNYNSTRRLYIDIKEIRINHYIMRTKEDAIRSAQKWNKIGSRLGQIKTNKWFRIVFDDTVTESKRLM
ncbi:hypothetical protein I4U23_010214 [Adineta vaga]|nr:hypothetical protein I4U23_010214 [Adineta vaga]